MELLSEGDLQICRRRCHVQNLADEDTQFAGREATLAEGDQILAVPTLVRQLPEPLRKIIGDLSDTQKVLVGLDLKALRIVP